MKKSQRARLASLKAKDQATLSEAEKNELKQLDALAVQHPDSAKDEDDTKPLSASDFLGRLTSAFQAKAALADENSRLKARVAELEKGTASQADANNAAVAAANAAKVTAETSLGAAQTQLSAFNAIFASIGSAFGLKPEELATKSPEAARLALLSRVELRAGERLAELGFPASGIPVATKEATGATTADLLDEYAKTSDPSKRAALFASSIMPLISSGKS